MDWEAGVEGYVFQPVVGPNHEMVPAAQGEDLVDRAQGPVQHPIVGLEEHLHPQPDTVGDERLGVLVHCAGSAFR